MKKQEEQKQFEIDDFEKHCNLWNIVLDDKSIILLRSIVDSIQSDNYSAPYNTLPSFLLIGVGSGLTSKALVNSLAITDVRTCPSQYFDEGIPSYRFFLDSIDTAHIITEVEFLTMKSEPTLWKYLKKRECNYYNYTNRKYDRIVHCFGLIVMTAIKRSLVSDSILRATDHIIELQPLNQDQLEAVIHQRLVFCKIDYEGDEILRAIIGANNSEIGSIMKFLKTCIVMMKAEMKDCLDMEVVNKVKRMAPLPDPAPPMPDGTIPF